MTECQRVLVPVDTPPRSRLEQSLTAIIEVDATVDDAALDAHVSDLLDAEVGEIVREHGDSKTPAGRPHVKIRGALRDELSTMRSRVTGPADGYVLPTQTGARLRREKVRNRVLAPAIKRANETLAEAELALRRTTSRLTRCAAPSARCCTRSARTPAPSWTK